MKTNSIKENDGKTERIIQKKNDSKTNRKTKNKYKQISGNKVSKRL